MAHETPRTDRTPDDARHRPQVGDVSTSTDGSTLTVVTVYPTTLSVRRNDGFTFGIATSDWARDPYDVWSWTPGGAS